MLPFRDTLEKFELSGDLLEVITNKNYNVELSNLADKKIMYDFPREIYFEKKATGNKSTRDRSIISLLETACILVTASGVSSSHEKKSFSKTLFLSSNANELCDR